MYKIYFIFIPKIIPKTFCLSKSGCFYPFLHKKALILGILDGQTKRLGGVYYIHLTTEALSRYRVVTFAY